MRQQANPTRRELLLKWAMGAALTLWAAYVFHSEVVGQGLVGWIADVAVRRFGSVSDHMALGLAMLAGAIPIGLMFQLIARLLGIRLVKRRRGELPAGTPSQIRRTAVLGAVGILAAAAVLTLIAIPRDDGAPPVPFDLEAPGAAAPPDGARVAVMGTLRRELAAGYRETVEHSDRSKTFLFTPLTPKDWTPDVPVQFFVAEVRRSDDASARGIVAVAGPDHRMRYQGQLRRNAMATLGRGALERHGVRVADTYWVIANDREQLMGVVVLIGCLGLALGLAVILVGWRDARQVAARDARRQPPTPPTPPGGPSRGRPPTPPPLPRNDARAQHPMPPRAASRGRRATPPPLPPGALGRRSA